MTVTTTPTALTVAENSAATPIRIPSPVDSWAVLSSYLTVTVKALPTDGAVYLSDGTTLVTVGEKLSVAQLTGLTFKPTAGQFSQSSTFSYSVVDFLGVTASGTATLTIGPQTAPPPPDTTPPTTTAASLTVAENAGPTAIGIAAPTDPNYTASQLTVTVSGLPNDGTVYLADGTTVVTAGETLSVAQLTGLTFKPTAGQFSQSSSLSYTVTNPSNLGAAGSATLAIGPDRTPPTTTSASLTVAPNAGPTAIGISAPTDINFSAAQLIVTVNGLPSDGTVYLADGTTVVTAGETLTVAQLTGLTFKPTAGQSSQSSSLTYTVADPAALSTGGSATLAIGATAAPPTTTAASLTVAENAGPTAIGIAAPTDSNYSAAQLTVTLNGLPSDGTVYLANGTTAVTVGETLTVAQLSGLTFKPTAGQFSQSSSLSYTVTNPSSLSAAGSATLAIGPAPPPTTSSASLTVAQNAAPTAIGIAAPTDLNYSAAQLTVTVNSLPTDGAVFLSDGTSAVTAGETLTVAQLTGLIFKPTTGLSSQSSTFTYTVKDPGGLSAAGSATLAIAAAPSTAVRTTAASLTVAEGAGPTPIGIAPPTDASYASWRLTVTVNSLPSDGTVYLANGTTPVTVGETLSVAQLTGLTFKPTAGQFSKSSTFTCTVTDPLRRSASGVATLAIGPDTTPPKTTAASLTVAGNSGPTAIGIAAPTDPNFSAGQLTVTVNGLPSDGTVYLADGTTAVTAGETLTVAQLTGLTFKPTPGQFSQSSSLTYTVGDPAGLSAAGSATLAISAPATPPTTTPASLTVAENAGPTAIGIAAPTDPKYSASQLTVTVNGLPSDGTVYLANGTTAVTAGETLTVAQLTGLTFKPTAGQFSQSSSLTYTVKDPLGLSAAGSATLAIGPDTTPPTTTAVILTVAENSGPTAIGIPAPTDPNYSAAQLTVIVPAVNGLPTDGTVYLADGTTAVTAGETLTVAQLTGLTFKPTPGQSNQSSWFSYSVMDPAGLITPGSATLEIAVPATPPTTTPTALIVAENAAPTFINIPTPTDANYSFFQLTVTVNGLPSDGTVYLADGTTAVTLGETLTTQQLGWLTFKPTPGLFSQSSSFTYTVTDPAGRSAAGSATLTIGPATPPATSAASLTVAENAFPTAIGIAAPTDANYSASQLTVTVNGLPSDGAVFLADGTTPVTSGETLSVAQLTGLTFKPTPGQFSQSSSFSYTVTDPSGLSTAGSATLSIGAATTGGITFNNTFGAGVSAAYQTAVLTAEAQISSLWTNPITLNLEFDASAMGKNGILAENSFYIVDVSYSELKSALAAHATSSYAASAVAALPASDPSGGAGWGLPQSYAQMLGLVSSSPSPEDFITLNTSYYPTFGQDVVGTLEHEITEGAMGRIGGLGSNALWSTMDLFRYNSSGVPDYTNGRDGRTTYFSYNGGKTLSSLSFNNEFNGNTEVNVGDTADFNQLDVFGTGSPGLSLSLSQTDIQVMDALGWAPSGASAASGFTLVNSGGSVASSGAATTPKGAGQSQFNADLFRNFMASTFVPTGPTLLTLIDEAPDHTPQLTHPHALG